MQRVGHGLVFHMRHKKKKYQQHAEPIHLQHDLFARGLQAAAGVSGRRGRPIQAVANA